MRFIRAFWGDLENFNQRHKNEIIDCSKNKELMEVVYVWGLENYNFITSLGYTCVLVSEAPTQYGKDFLFDSNIYMLHKLEAIKLGIEKYREVIFLDWDCIQLKPVDNNFYISLYKRNRDIQMPLYIYPKDYSTIVLNDWIDITPKEREYVIKQQVYLEKYNYEWNNCFVTPNAGFIYASDIKIIEELIRINQVENIGIASEEMSFVVYAKRTCKNLLDYIETYEPYVCNAKREDHFNQKEINQFISQYMKKDLYFQHI